MPNAEVRRKWDTVARGGFADAERAEATTKLARVTDRMEAQPADGREWLLGEACSRGDIKWYSMVPGLLRLVPEVCNPELSPRILGWLERVAARPAVEALEQYRAASTSRST